MSYFTLDYVKCFECGEHVPILNLEEHVLRSHGYVKCLQCDVLINPNRWAAHNERYHNTQANTLTSQKFNCAECNEEVSFLDFGKHLLLKHDFVECNICRTLFVAGILRIWRNTSLKSMVKPFALNAGYWQIRIK